MTQFGRAAPKPAKLEPVTDAASMPRRLRIEDTHYPKWVPLREGGVTHRLIYVEPPRGSYRVGVRAPDELRPYFLAACSKGGHSAKRGSGEICRACVRLGWDFDTDERIRKAKAKVHAA